MRTRKKKNDFLHPLVVTTLIQPSKQRNRQCEETLDNCDAETCILPLYSKVAQCVLESKLSKTMLLYRYYSATKLFVLRASRRTLRSINRVFLLSTYAVTPPYNRVGLLIVGITVFHGCQAWRNSSTTKSP